MVFFFCGLLGRSENRREPFGLPDRSSESEEIIYGTCLWMRGNLLLNARSKVNLKVASVNLHGDEQIRHEPSSTGLSNNLLCVLVVSFV